MVTLTSWCDYVEANLVLGKRSRKLLGHVRHGGLARRVRIMRKGNTAKCSNRARDDHLTALCHIALLVASIQQGQKGGEAEIGTADVDIHDLLEGIGISVPEVLLNIGEGLLGGHLNRGRARDASIRDEQVDVSCLLSDLGYDAL
jgi:hypothetical protein